MGQIFEIVATDPYSKARAGVLYTAHGTVHTPVFMPVATQGAIKAFNHREAENLSYRLLLANTYHLYLRPGIDVLHRFGGLHKLMQWKYALLTDSGGFQVYSLSAFRHVRDDGVEFRSHIDGSRHFFTPRNVIHHQRVIGSNIIMPLDECVDFQATRNDVEQSIQRSIQWARESYIALQDMPDLYGYKQYLFGIIQGGVYKELRYRCSEEVCQFPFDGYALGGLAVGEPAELMYEIVDFSTGLLPTTKPRYLMGVGTPQNILRTISLGIDMFDCVLPTRNARNGTVFTTRGKINIRNQSFKLSDEPVDPLYSELGIEPTSLGYLRHLFIAGEILGLILATLQNLAFYSWLVRSAREKILDGSFRQWSQNFLEQYYPDVQG